MYEELFNSSVNYNQIFRLMEKPQFLYQEHKKSDSGYKYLFGIKKYFLEFLRDFIKIKEIDGISENDIEQVSSEFILSNFSSRQSDIVYRVTSSNEEIYFVLLELQSKVDELMSFRVLEYMVEIWRKYIIRNTTYGKGEKCLKKSLPLIIPCVLYNGKYKWSKSRNFKNLFKNATIYKDIIPNFEYILIDINNYSDKDLLSFGSVIGNVMYIDKGKNGEEIKQRILDLVERLRGLSRDDQKCFTEWVLHLFAKTEKEVVEIKYKIFDKEEENMLEELVREWENNTYEKGEKNGIEKGEKIGIEKGEKIGIEKGEKIGRIDTLIRILINKFGDIPQDIERKVFCVLENRVDVVESKIFELNNWEDILKL